MTAAALPDDIEQYLIIGQRLRATVVLAQRRSISIQEARDLVVAWLADRQRRAEEGGTNDR